MLQKFLFWIKHVFLNLPDDISLADETTRKIVMIFLCTFLGMFFMLFLGAFAFMEGEFFLGVIDFACAAILLGLFSYIRIKGSYYIILDIILVVIMLFFLLLFASGAARHQSFVWFYTYPILTLFFFGRKKGAILTFLLVALSFLIYLFQDHFSFYTPYPDGSLIRILFSYILVFIFTIIFESSRENTNDVLMKTLGELKDQSIRDGLTNLYNRRYLDEIFPLLLKQRSCSKDMTFLMADLDFFKRYNDTYGHQKGDEVLQHFSTVLRSEIRRETDYIFRYGGEEFCILLDATNRETAENITDSIIKATYKLNIPHETSSFGRITVSVGVSYVKGCSGNVEEIIKVADDALYEAKKNGRNQFLILEYQ
ncbi:MAG: hypothetical protein B6241_11645 [Spirochaetaceae bacterium 4572_59]|nr:MAG: hypothetical protein B6241_11645 [Spirochaetaceae bacterium 4572_59]